MVGGRVLTGLGALVIPTSTSRCADYQGPNVEPYPECENKQYKAATIDDLVKSPIYMNDAPTIPKPSKKNGKSVCYARVNASSNKTDVRVFSFGIGVGRDNVQAKEIARRMAMANLPVGYANIHHTSFKCIDKKGVHTSGGQ